MKKTISLFLTLIMLLSITAGLNLTALAETSGDFEYEMLENSDAAKITKYNGSSSELVIP